MADHREVRYERLYVKSPNGEKLRKTASGRLKGLVSAGWRETERTSTPDYVQVRLERSGQPPLMTKLPHIPPPPGRTGRGPGFAGRGPGGPGRGPGGPGGPGRGPGGPRR